MSDQATLPQTVQPSRQKITAKPKRIAPKLKRALDLMVWGDPETPNAGAMPWNEAAHAADLNIRAMRLALERSHVRRYLNEQRQVFCAQASSGNISRAVAIRDQDDNKMAAVQAMRFIEDVATERVADRPGRVTTPGIQIVINAARQQVRADPTIIEVNPVEDAAALDDGDE